MVQPKITMVGRTYGRLTVLEQAEPLKKDRQAWYRCRCDCGGEITVRGTSLRNGSTASCGCLRREKTKKRNAEAAGKKFDLTGKRFAFLTAEKRLEERKKGSCLWLCRCDCGRYYKGKTHDLISGRVKSCGCIPSRVPEDLTGRRYGSLTVLELSGERRKNGAVVWKCRCDCGQETFVSSGNLKQGRTVSCGCVRRENLEGRRFGKLIVTGIGKQSGRGRGAFWNCLCDCGTYCEVHAYKLKSGSYAQLRLFSQGSNSGSYRAEIWQTDGAGRQREEKGRIRRNDMEMSLQLWTGKRDPAGCSGVRGSSQLRLREIQGK